MNWVVRRGCVCSGCIQGPCVRFVYEGVACRLVCRCRFMWVVGVGLCAGVYVGLVCRFVCRGCI